MCLNVFNDVTQHGRKRVKRDSARTTHLDLQYAVRLFLRYWKHSKIEKEKKSEEENQNILSVLKRIASK